MAYIDFNDSSIPLGKRKQAFVKWLMQRQGLSLREARIACSRKFGRNEGQLRQARDERTTQKWTQLQERSHRTWGSEPSAAPSRPDTGAKTDRSISGKELADWLLSDAEAADAES